MVIERREQRNGLKGLSVGPLDMDEEAVVDMIVWFLRRKSRVQMLIAIAAEMRKP